MSFRPSDSLSELEAMTALKNYILDVRAWMRKDMLWLNDEIIIIVAVVIIIIIIIIVIVIIIIISIIIITSSIAVFAGVLFVHQPGANRAPGASVTQVNHSVHTLSTFLRIRVDPSMQVDL